MMETQFQKSNWEMEKKVELKVDLLSFLKNGKKIFFTEIIGIS